MRATLRMETAQLNKSQVGSAAAFLGSELIKNLCAISAASVTVVVRLSNAILTTEAQRTRRWHRVF
jgi:hypothetical protein